jgi:uncharacterized protein YdeI (BOF family)
LKKNTPYALTPNSKLCLYCGEVFTSTRIYKDGFNYQVSAQKQLEGHFLNAHASSNTIQSSTQKREDDTISVQGKESFRS